MSDIRSGDVGESVAEIYRMGRSSVIDWMAGGLQQRGMPPKRAAQLGAAMGSVTAVALGSIGVGALWAGAMMIAGGAPALLVIFFYGAAAIPAALLFGGLAAGQVNGAYRLINPKLDAIHLTAEGRIRTNLTRSPFLAGKLGASFKPVPKAKPSSTPAAKLKI